MDKDYHILPDSTESMDRIIENKSLDASASVSSLIQHNQDLSSRLRVALSRTIELEKTINRFKKIHAQYEERFQSARDQVAIYKEKEAFLKKEKSVLSEKAQKLRAHLEYERKEHFKKEDNLQTKIALLEPQAEDYKKLKERVEQEYLPQRDLLRAQLKEEEQNYLDLDMEKRSLLKKLGEASSHIQEMAKDFKEKMEDLKQGASLEISSLKQKLDSVQNENIVLSDRNRSLRKDQIESTELLNRIEEIKKQKEFNLREFKEEKEDLLIQISHLKKENDRVKIENHDIKKQWSKTQSDFREFKKSSEGNKNEAESLRALWQEKSNKFSGIEKLNESLEVQLNEAEAKAAQLQESQQESKQRLKFFFSQVESMIQKQGEKEQRGTQALLKAFKKAIEPIIDYDYNP